MPRKRIEQINQVSMIANGEQHWASFLEPCELEEAINAVIKLAGTSIGTWRCAGFARPQGEYWVEV